MSRSVVRPVRLLFVTIQAIVLVPCSRAFWPCHDESEFIPTYLPDRVAHNGPGSGHSPSRCAMSCGVHRVTSSRVLRSTERPYCVVYFTSADFLHRDALHVVRSLFELKLSSSSKSKRVSWELLGSLNHCSQGAIDRLKACEVPVVPWTFAFRSRFGNPT